MKIATWNVNGIRARQAQVQEWVERECPDIVCLQEIKASPDQIPVWLCEMEGYWCYWHGEKGYSGVALHVSKRISPERPAFEHPAFDYENRIPYAWSMSRWPSAMVPVFTDQGNLLSGGQAPNPKCDVSDVPPGP